MRLEGNISKVAICKKCKGLILASHVDYLSKQTEKQFTQFTNEGFEVKLENAEQTRNRDFSDYSKCRKGLCTDKINN